MELDITSREIELIESYIDQASDPQLISRIRHNALADVEKNTIAPAIRKLITFGVNAGVEITDRGILIDLKRVYSDMQGNNIKTLLIVHQATSLYSQLIDEYKGAVWRKNNLGQ
jgi:hypothetical protein